MDDFIQSSEAPTNANTATNSTTAAAQFAGNASLRSDPSSLSPAALMSSHADLLWCADTGATSHMTPHRHWLRNYKPFRAPVRLANNTIVYSAGVGSVVFTPEVEGQRLQAVEFSNVLHVPELGNNLLSVLYLTRHKQFSVVILETVMNFVRSGKVWFTAAVNASNCAYCILKDPHSQPVHLCLHHLLYLLTLHCGIEDSAIITTTA